MPKKKCPHCKGEGRIFGDIICGDCGGAGYVFKKPTVKQMKKIAKLIKENK